ncbi:hypothetical protein KC973_02605 [Candidatus Saccharibacteria bacterium]|nr:hypothetical protein [Candidatus Saccharibacteria bacterium]
MEVPKVPINDSDPHVLADTEAWLNQAIHDELVLSIEGIPSSRTQAYLSASGVDYDTHPVYPLLLDDTSRNSQRARGKVVGYEYRFAGLEVDVADGTGGSYVSFPVSKIAELAVLESV